MTAEQIAILKDPKNLKERFLLFDRLLLERNELQEALRQVLPLCPQGRAFQRTIYDAALAAYAFSKEKQ